LDRALEQQVAVAVAVAVAEEAEHAKVLDA
jgi:hypothetical protein